MTSRIDLLEAVAEAARAMQRVIQPDIDTTPRNCREAAYLAAVALSNALAALPPAQPAGETAPKVVQLSTSENGLYALGSDGSLWFWGTNNWQQEPTPPGFLHDAVEPTP